MPDSPPPAVGFVAIGRNEGLRLRACLRSLAGGPIVYVDSGSTDDSLELARAAGALTAELDLASPFTAARARNLGLQRLRAAHPATEFVQFVDGDCELRAGWVEAGLTALRAHPDVAVACGRRRERFPEASVYNRLCDVEWDTPVGEAAACGGGARRAGAAAGSCASRRWTRSAATTPRSSRARSPSSACGCGAATGGSCGCPWR
jgi:glycosyltransferase involved in cell wall biosynthesis